MSAPSVSPPLDSTLWVGAPDPRQAWANSTFTANAAFFTAFQVRRPVTVSTANCHVATQSGNLDLGVFRDAGGGSLVLVGSTGSFACPAPGAVSRALTASVTLFPGVRYYVAHAHDNGTARLYWGTTGVSTTYLSDLALIGQAAACFPLASATLAAFTGTVVGAFIYFT